MRIRTGLPQVLNLHPARPQPVHRLLLLTNHWQLAVGGTEHGAMETGMLGLIMPLGESAIALGKQSNAWKVNSLAFGNSAN